MAGVSNLGYFGKGAPGKPHSPPISRFPKMPLFSALAFIAFAVGAVVFGQATGIGTLKNVSQNPVAIRDVLLTRNDTGQVVVKDAKTGIQLAAYGENEGGFVRGSLRGLERIRFTTGISYEVPYRIIKWDNGAVSLSDTATGERLYLNAFGKDNAAAFEQFLLMNSSGESAGGTASIQ